MQQLLRSKRLAETYQLRMRVPAPTHTSWIQIGESPESIQWIERRPTKPKTVTAPIHPIHYPDLEPLTHQNCAVPVSVTTMDRHQLTD